MKKILKTALVLAVALVLAFSLAACGKEQSKLSGTTTELLNSFNDAAKLEIFVGTDAIPDDNAEYFCGLTNDEYAKLIEEGSYSEAMIGSIAHSEVILKVKKGESAKDVADKVFKNVNTRKWICVEAEKLIVNYSGDYVFMVMSFADTADAIYNAFTEAAGTVGTAQTKTAAI